MDSELLLLALFDPRRAAREAPGRQPLVSAALVLVLAAFSESLAAVLVARATSGQGSGLLFVLWSTILGLGSIGLTLLTGSIFLPFGARMVGGRGEAEDLLWILALAFVPCTVWAGLGLLFQMTPVAAGLYFLAHLLVAVWVLWIQVQGLAEVFGLSVLRALFATFLGYGLAALLYVLFSGMGFLSLVNTLVLWAT